MQSSNCHIILPIKYCVINFNEYQHSACLPELIITSLGALYIASSYQATVPHHVPPFSTFPHPINKVYQLYKNTVSIMTCLL